MKRKEIITLSVFDQDFKRALAYLGSHTGRKSNKIAEAGLTLVFDEGMTYYAEAKMVVPATKEKVHQNQNS